MILCDVNVLIYAHRADAPNHAAYRTWLENVINENAAYAVSDIILSGFLRVVTHPRVFAPPSSVSAALTFAGQLRQEPNAVMVMPENRHWTIFTDLCRAVDARGNLIPDAFLAALAIESGSEWITTDRDFSRFPGLNWRHPLEE
jgi:uncharacterized protein